MDFWRKVFTGLNAPMYLGSIVLKALLFKNSKNLLLYIHQNLRTFNF